jgi:hypothetical protein
VLSSYNGHVASARPDKLTKSFRPSKSGDIVDNMFTQNDPFRDTVIASIDHVVRFQKLKCSVILPQKRQLFSLCGNSNNDGGWTVKLKAEMCNSPPPPPHFFSYSPP